MYYFVYKIRHINSYNPNKIFALIIYAKQFSNHEGTYSGMKSYYSEYFKWTTKPSNLGNFISGHLLSSKGGKQIVGKKRKILSNSRVQNGLEISACFLIASPDYESVLKIANSCPSLDNDAVVEIRELISH